MEMFKEQIAVITGASSGIGKAIALGLAAQGAQICLVGRSIARLRLVEESIRASSKSVLAYKADLTLDADIRNLLKRLQRDCGKIHILVHSVGVFFMGRHEEARIEHLDLQFRSNVRGPYLLTQYLLPLLKASQGQVVFINSTMGLGVRENVGQFAMTQHAFKAMADTLREEVNSDGIRVISVFPGRTATRRQTAIFEDEGRIYQPEVLLQPEDVAVATINALAMPWTAEVTDIMLRPMKKSY